MRQEFDLSGWAKVIGDRIKKSIRNHKQGNSKAKAEEVVLPVTVKKKVPGASFSVRSGLGTFLRGKPSQNPEDALIEKEEKEN